MGSLITILYISVVAALSLYGLLGFVTLALFWWYKDGQENAPQVESADLPRVTIQLPVYNERLVVERLIDAVASQNYPRDRLQIQVVDDSDDETVAIAQERIMYYRMQGLAIEHVRRLTRRGYKAGALANAQNGARGDYVAIFDADFSPGPDFLLNTVPYFVDNPNLGMIQARWGHINDFESPLTAAQSIALDKHFVMEQNVRHRANLFPKFNGSAGIWRRTCIEHSGGWQSDTVCEDLCLSTRATLKGWQFRYLDNVVAPAELPASIRAYKNQQARWAKGSIQCLRKYGLQILRDEKHTLFGRLYALLSMSAYTTHLLLIILLLLQIPMLLLNVQLPPIMIVFAVFAVGQPALFILAQRVTYTDWRRRLAYFPTLLLVAIGLAPSNTRAILQTLRGDRHHPFIRTPKGGSTASSASSANSRPYRLPGDGTLWVELLLAVYAATGVALALNHGQYGSLFLLSTSFIGFAYVALLELRELRLL
jgi:cellulose synthase/poly-beta-1,6-N-acetylglucosamine synthase-like glycosyltransferase